MNKINIRKMTEAEEYLAENELNRKPKEYLGTDQQWNFGIWFIAIIFVAFLIYHVVKYF